MRRAFTSGTAGIKRHSVALQTKFHVDGICEQLRRTRIHFVHCFLPQHNAGLCDVKGGPMHKSLQQQSPDDILMNVPLVRSQVKRNKSHYFTTLFRFNTATVNLTLSEAGWSSH